MTLTIQNYKELFFIDGWEVMGKEDVIYLYAIFTP